MAFSDSAVPIVATAKFYTAVTGTAVPTNYLSPAVAWDNFGHTSLDNIFALSSEGGDVTVLGTLQSPQFRTRVAPRTDSFALVSNQFDLDHYKMYFGSNATQDSTSKLVRVPNAPTAVEKAFLAVFDAGDKAFAIYAERCEFKRNEDLSIDSTEAIAGIPIQVTPLTYNGSTSNWGLTTLELKGTAPFGP